MAINHRMFVKQRADLLKNYQHCEKFIKIRFQWVNHSAVDPSI